MVRDEMDEMCCKSVGTDLSMLDIDDFITEISQLKKKVALLETKLRSRGDEELKREDVDVVCCESSTQNSELSLTLLGYTESKATDAQDTTVCDSNEGLQEDQTSTESLDSLYNVGEQQQILQTKLKMCSVKLIDCRNLVMEMRGETTDEEHNTDEDNHDDEDFIPSDEKSDLCCDEETPSTSKERPTAQTLSCITCGKTFSSQRNLETHERKHTEQKLFTSTRSKISFTTLQEKNVYSEEHREKKKQFHCDECGMICVSSYKLNVHMRTHSGEKPYYCTECGNHFCTKQGLNVHQRIHTGEKPYECPHCEKRFSRTHHLKAHVLLHTNEKPYQCGQCEKTFRHSSSLKLHQNIHSGEKHHQCSHCDKRFGRKSHLKVHERVHIGVKPYYCSVCGRSFSQHRDVVRHQRTHTGEKPYNCSQCEKTFAQSDFLKVHERVHTGVKPYYCSVCGKSFSRRDHLVRHQRTHTGEKPYTCSQCEKTFAQLGTLKIHERIHTGEKPSTA
ncbi:uncharacterized protein [Paramisgurnus dabryanus]